MVSRPYPMRNIFINTFNCKVVITPQNISYNVQKKGFFLKDYIEVRATQIANYIIENNATVRQTAKEFEVDKSTVYIR